MDESIVTFDNLFQSDLCYRMSCSSCISLIQFESFACFIGFSEYIFRLT